MSESANIGPAHQPPLRPATESTAPSTSPTQAPHKALGGGAKLSSSRLAEIDQIRDTDFDRYEAEGLDKERLAYVEQELIDRRRAAGDTADIRAGVGLARVEMTGSSVGREIFSAWEGDKGAAFHLGRAQSRAEIVLAGSTAREALVAGFDALPEPARHIVIGELALNPPRAVEPAGEGELARFGKSPEGRALVAEWGVDAPEKVARIAARLDRVLGQCDADEAEALQRWALRLDSAGFKALLKMLAG